MKKRLFTVMAVLVITFSACGNSVAKVEESVTVYETVILAQPDDPYFPLAEEISSVEGIPIFTTLSEASTARPIYLLWVVSPANLSEEKMYSFLQEMNGLASSISIGIISGKTIDDARRLWLGHEMVGGSTYAIINGTKKGKIFPGIFQSGEEETRTFPLTKTNIIETLENNPVVQISMEGAGDTWFDDSEDIFFRYSDLPELNGSIIQNYGCSTFRPWVENSIALEAISRGAVAYAGFVYASVQGTRFGDYTDVDLLHTWEGFPVGQVVQIQNNAAMQSYARYPHFFLLGDPRIYLESGQPYVVVSDEIEGSRRVITLGDVESGLIPILIEGGSKYEYVRVSGLTASSENAKFFNKSLQMIDIYEDKYVIIENEDKTVTLELYEKTPLFWTVGSHVRDFLDSIITGNQATSLPLFLAGAEAIFLVIGLFRKRIGRRDLLTGLLTGICIAFITLGYILLRAERMTITNTPITVNWAYLFGILAFTGYGSILHLRAGSCKGRIVAVLVANTYSVFTLFLFAVGWVIASLATGGGFGINKPGYPYLSAFLQVIVGMIAYGLIFHWIGRIRKKLVVPHWTPGSEQ